MADSSDPGRRPEDHLQSTTIVRPYRSVDSGTERHPLPQERPFYLKRELLLAHRLTTEGAKLLAKERSWDKRALHSDGNQPPPERRLPSPPLDKRQQRPVQSHPIPSSSSPIVSIARCVAGSSAAHFGQVSERVWPKEASLPTPTWAISTTGNEQRFRGLSPVSDKIVWVAGTNSTVLRSTDGGGSWESVGPALSDEDAESQYRDVQAWSAESAVALAIGEGTDSRIYMTHDAGKTWTRSFTNDDPAAFYDCLAFESPQRGLAVSDPVDGKFRLIETLDGSETWSILDSSGMPDALDGEAGFAASGTCLSTAAGRWYLASGGIDPGRVFRSADGYAWKVANSSIAGGAAAGIFSVAFRDAHHGISVGGDYENPNVMDKISAWSSDGGTTWLPSVKYPGGYRSGASWIPGLCGVAVAVGPTGSDITIDGGKTWYGFDTGSFDSVECVGGHVCWASGEDGRVARLSLQ
ncbi:hypothetical protein BJ170DRAFT_696959 [Xylariales sp. AK1849]|nr:hypothetical protein BJ170DRAFT_696959 [Xylariales sp. AK1849]